ncbi:MAG: amino acid ABC transporter permease [Intrasporangium sp.]|uniref:amino acid ABC transporter permease n=1 Tax=Intrasporangium sp. TaxID=1925024 RepID=UPI002648AF88|nr:amino acid ABC transporter permease [Intrasporangium sp.]MDN5796101.1 amino acid ABC transporter permease [Intrasporangium sp.]
MPLRPDGASLTDPWRPSPTELERRAYRRARTTRSALVSATSTIVVGALVGWLVTRSEGWPRVQETFFSWDKAVDSFPAVLTGIWLNIRIMVICGIAIAIIGMTLAIMRTLRGPIFFPLRLFATAYVDLFRGLPLLLVIYLLGFGVPALRLPNVPSSLALWGGVAITLSYSAYVAEVFRAGIESVHPSQRAASRALGLSHGQTLRHVVVPQAVRRVMPPLMNDLVSLQKDSGLIAVLGVVDAIRAAQIESATDFNYTPYVVAGFLFICLTIPMARFTDHVAKRQGWHGSGGTL